MDPSGLFVIQQQIPTNPNQTCKSTGNQTDPVLRPCEQDGAETRETRTPTRLATKVGERFGHIIPKQVKNTAAHTATRTLKNTAYARSCSEDRRPRNVEEYGPTAPRSPGRFEWHSRRARPCLERASRHDCVEKQKDTSPAWAGCELNFGRRTRTFTLPRLS